MAVIFADDIIVCISLNANFWISNKISLKYVPYGLIDNEPFPEPMMVWFTEAYMRHSASMS